MRSRNEIEDDSRDSNTPYEKLMVELLLDIREQLNEIIKHLENWV